MITKDTTKNSARTYAISTIVTRGRTMNHNEISYIVTIVLIKKMKRMELLSDAEYKIWNQMLITKYAPKIRILFADI